MLAKLKSLLEKAEDRESFFRMVGLFLPAIDPRYQLIERAYNEAKDAFRDTFRDSGERYFEHLRRTTTIQMVYLRIRDYRLLVGGLLHDLVEDIPDWTIERIRLTFGDEVALYVGWITKPPLNNFSSEEERDKAYFARFPLAPRDFWLIKLPDRLDNLLTMWPYPPEKRARKIEETRVHYLPFAEKELILLHELEEAIEEAEKIEHEPSQTL